MQLIRYKILSLYAILVRMRSGTKVRFDSFRQRILRSEKDTIFASFSFWHQTFYLLYYLNRSLEQNMYKISLRFIQFHSSLHVCRNDACVPLSTSDCFYQMTEVRADFFYCLSLCLPL